MTVSAKVYGLAIKSAFGGSINYLTDTIKVMLVSSSYTPNQDTHDFKDDVTGEVSGTGYTARGQALASKTLTYDGPTNVLTLDAADTIWTTATLSGVRYAIIYKDTGTDSTSPLLGYVDLGADAASTAADFALNWNASGIIALTVS